LNAYELLFSTAGFVLVSCFFLSHSPFSMQTNSLAKQNENVVLNSAVMGLDFDALNLFYCAPDNETLRYAEQSISLSLNSSLEHKAYIFYSDDFIVFNKQKKACIDEITLKSIVLKNPCRQNIPFFLGFWDFSREVKETC